MNDKAAPQQDRSELQRIKRYADKHGVGCVVIGDHAAISTSLGGDGAGRAQRVTTLDQARAVLGCHCKEDDNSSGAA